MKLTPAPPGLYGIHAEKDEKDEWGMRPYPVDFVAVYLDQDGGRELSPCWVDYEGDVLFHDLRPGFLGILRLTDKVTTADHLLQTRDGKTVGAPPWMVRAFHTYVKKAEKK